jgi:hypothetical protein
MSGYKSYELGVMNYEWGRQLFVFLCVTKRTVTEKHGVKKEKREKR